MMKKIILSTAVMFVFAQASFAASLVEKTARLMSFEGEVKIMEQSSGEGVTRMYSVMSQEKAAKITATIFKKFNENVLSQVYESKYGFVLISQNVNTQYDDSFHVFLSDKELFGDNPSIPYGMFNVVDVNGAKLMVSDGILFQKSVGTFLPIKMK